MPSPRGAERAAGLPWRRDRERRLARPGPTRAARRRRRPGPSTCRAGGRAGRQAGRRARAPTTEDWARRVQLEDAEKLPPASSLRELASLNLLGGLTVWLKLLRRSGWKLRLLLLTGGLCLSPQHRWESRGKGMEVRFRVEEEGGGPELGS